MQVLCLALLALTPQSGSAPATPAEQGAAAGTSAAPSDIGLVLVLNVDSMFPEQLQRLGIWWKGGFRRLLDHGTVFDDAALPYAHTETAPGHASFGTGCLPSSHGITRDFLVDSATGRQIGCVFDADARTIDSYDWVVADSGSASAGRLRRGGWAEALRSAWPASRSISISGKGTSAVLLGGKAPGLALWWDSYGRGFVSSSAYCDELPTWLVDWNSTWPSLARGWSWEAQLPGERQLTSTAADDRPGEAAICGRTPVFPYPALDLPEVLEPRNQAALAGRVFLTPQMDRLVCQLAKRAVQAAELGADGSPDLLAISLSACDLLGNAAGPYSLEVTSALLLLDRELGELFQFLDSEVGAQRWLVAFSSDHGLLELPEGHARINPGAVRLRVRARRQALQLLRSRLQAEFGEDFGVNLTGRGDGVVFAPAVLASTKADPAALRRAAAEALDSLPWVADTYTREELALPAAKHEDPWLTLARNSYHEEGGVDVELRLAHRHLMGVLVGTQSGSPYKYDRRQPLIFMGPGFASARRPGKASSIDALPTLLARLGLAGSGDYDGLDLLADPGED